MSYKPYYAGGWQSGESGGTPLTPEALQHFDNGIISAHRAGQPQNLAVNSDFTNPVNQRKAVAGEFAVNTYPVDCWSVMNNPIKCDYSDAGIIITSTSMGGITQRLRFNESDIGKTYTFAVMTDEGIVVTHGKLPDTDAWNIFGNAENSKVNLQLCRYGGTDRRLRLDIFVKATTATIVWAALYKGEYTAETLPEYQPKGCAAELLECQRYFLSVNKDPVGSGYIGNNNVVYLAVPVPVSMRVVPTVVLSGNLKVWSDGKEYDASNVSVYSAGQNSVTLKATVSGATAKKMAAGYVNGTMFLDANM